MKKHRISLPKKIIINSNNYSGKKLLEGKAKKYNLFSLL